MTLNELRPVLLRRLMMAIVCQSVDVLVIDLNGKAVARRSFTPPQFVDAHGWMAARGAERLHVYFRPIGHLNWVLVDDLTPGMLQLMRDDGVWPAAVVETSPFKPDKLQAWIAIGRDLPRDVHLAACRLLAARYGGDPGSAKPEQLGRVPSTMNAKPQYWCEGEQPPLVKLIAAPGVHFAFDVRAEATEKAETDRARREMQAERRRGHAPRVEVPREWREPLQICNRGKHVVTLSGIDDDPHALWQGWHVEPVPKATGEVDRSATDTRRVLSMLLGGVPEAIARDACRVGSDKAAQRSLEAGDDAAEAYVESVMRAATRMSKLQDCETAR